MCAGAARRVSGALRGTSGPPSRRCACCACYAPPAHHPLAPPPNPHLLLRRALPRVRCLVAQPQLAYLRQPLALLRQPHHHLSHGGVVEHRCLAALGNPQALQGAGGGVR